MKIDFKKVEVIEIDNIKHWDYPDYVAAYISEADYNGKPMSDKMLDEINDNYPDFVYEQVMKYIY